MGGERMRSHGQPAALDPHLNFPVYRRGGTRRLPPLSALSADGGGGVGAKPFSHRPSLVSA